MSLAGWKGWTLCALLLLPQIPALAGGEEWARIRRDGALQIGLEGTFPPYSQLASGQLQGFEVDFGRALAAQMGVEARFQTMVWDHMLDNLAAGRMDVVINQVVATPERRKRFEFSIPYTYSGLQLVVRKPDLPRFHGAGDLAGAHVGVSAGTNYEQWLRDNAPQAHIHRYPDDPTKYDGLRRGEVDAIVINRLAAFNLAQKTQGELAPAGRMLAREDACVVLRKGSPQLLAAVNRAIGHLQRDGTLQTLSRKWFKADIVSRPQ
ncbi:transporter substrate-binding domain-containing protein [Chromobacterium vaccinii]|uniref:Transporter substrate-binding domain-containing protein n=1 Tax=Chromobacterium vaccinii TaxID=1108595 RepID=A0ABV0FIU6_9NEIS|nr:transporter substrate-binding domain-containing protein [Chromobacterium vaccinii]MCD4484118.1 transporter substrate-binding domain-containing protein [Chromobacterium vaccinii]